MNFICPSGTDPVDRARKLGPAIEAAADECAQRIPQPLLPQLHIDRICRILLSCLVDGDESETWVYFCAIECLSRHHGSVGWNTFAANSAALIGPFMLPEMAETAFANPCTAVMVAWRPLNDSKAIEAPGSYSVAGIIALRCRASDLVVSAAA
jgi:hypothetical protein